MTNLESVRQGFAPQQERLFSVEVIDRQLAQDEIETIRVARRILEEQRQEAVSHYDNASPLRRFLSKRIGVLSLINESYDERQSNLDELEEFAHMLGCEDGISASFYFGIKEQIGDSRLIEQAEEIKGQQDSNL